MKSTKYINFHSVILPFLYFSTILLKAKKCLKWKFIKRKWYYFMKKYLLCCKILKLELIKFSSSSSSKSKSKAYEFSMSIFCCSKLMSQMKWVKLLFILWKIQYIFLCCFVSVKTFEVSHRAAFQLPMSARSLRCSPQFHNVFVVYVQWEAKK